MFDDVRGLISAADLAICHQETPISADDTDMGPADSLVFNVPREIGGALRNAGFRACDTASQAPGLTDDNEDGSLEIYTIDEVSPGRLQVTKMTYVPTWVEIPGHRIVRATPDHYGESYNRTVEAMNLLGPGACDARPAA